MTKLTIEKLGQKKVINTKFGAKEKCSFFADGKWFSYWINKETKDWHAGMTVEGDVVPREWEGKTYYDFNVIKPDYFGMILQKLEVIESLIRTAPVTPQKAQATMYDEMNPPPPTDDDAPEEELPF